MTHANQTQHQQQKGTNSAPDVVHGLVKHQDTKEKVDHYHDACPSASWGERTNDQIRSDRIGSDRIRSNDYPRTYRNFISVHLISVHVSSCHFISCHVISFDSIQSRDMTPLRVLSLGLSVAKSESSESSDRTGDGEIRTLPSASSVAPSLLPFSLSLSNVMASKNRSSESPFSESSLRSVADRRAPFLFLFFFFLDDPPKDDCCCFFFFVDLGFCSG
mmetsp:Transcript_21560/g.51078  ORF Transcript_21560/g.51078 Transcript_21560/m.51078 type:complete len:218 (-) Transcript_21560:502-1155(-)